MYKKRIFDILLSLLLIPFAAFICVVVAFLYLLIEKESPFFAQKRLGLGKKEFTLLKLRTMRANTEQVGTHEVSRAAVTKLGGFLRATKLDELPQIWNVLIGDMSFVGPRPGLLSQLELTEERERMGVFSIKPGITGPSQVHGIDMSDPVKLAFSDSKYLEDITFSRDIRLLLATALGAGYGDKIR